MKNLDAFSSDSKYEKEIANMNKFYVFIGKLYDKTTSVVFECYDEAIEFSKKQSLFINLLEVDTTLDYTALSTELAKTISVNSPDFNPVALYKIKEISRITSILSYCRIDGFTKETGIIERLCDV